MHLVYRLQPHGMELGVIKVVNGLDAKVVRSSICSTTTAAPMRDLIQPHVPIFECRRRSGSDLRLVGDLIKLFRRERPHIVHTHSWGTLCEGLLAARIARVPIVVHGEHGTLQLKRHQRWIQRRAWGLADCTLSVSSQLAARMAASTGFDVSRIRVIRNGVDLSRFSRVARADARRALDLADGGLVIGAVGRLVEVKDHITLFRAVAHLRREGIETTTLLAGEGHLRSVLESQIRDLGLDGCVRPLGHRSDVERVLAAMDIFVSSSQSEGLPNTVLEAMAAGLPVVATNVGGTGELVQSGVTGLLVPARDSAALAGGLKELCVSAPLRETFGAAARMRSEIHFSLRSMVVSYERLYVELFDQYQRIGGHP